MKNERKEIRLSQLVARKGEEYLFVDYFFDSGEMDGKPFRGVTGFTLVPVSVAEHEYRTSQEGAEEYLEDSWATMCSGDEDYEFGYGPNLEDMRGHITRQRGLERASRALDREYNDTTSDRFDRAESAMNELKERRRELAFKDFVQQVRRNDGDESFYDMSFCCSGAWEQIRERYPDTMGEDKVELFECIGCGRMWSEDRQEFDEVYNPALLNWIYWWERGGFHQYLSSK